MPWIIRKVIYVHVFKYSIGKGAKIGKSIILADKVTMKPFSEIKSFNYFNDIDHLYMGEFSKIGNRNWFTGLSTKYSYNYSISIGRKCFFKLGDHSVVTNFHFFDCSGGIEVGEYTAIGGINSVFYTHEINIPINRQTAAPISIGKYCIVSTSCKLVPNTKLPDYSVLGAGAVLTKRFSDPYGVFGGIPAKRVKDFDQDCKFFTRETGYVN